MTTYEVLEYLEYSMVGEWVAGSMWGYPITLASHALGMAIVVGLTAIISLRLLGFPKAIPLNVLGRFIPLLISGMVLNAVSGIALFFGGATTLFYNIAFQFKLVAIVIGIFMVRYLNLNVLRPAMFDELTDIETRTKLFALAITLLWWVSVVLSGRLIAYVGDY